MILLPKQYRSQPQLFTEVDWGNPLANGLLGQWTAVAPDSLGNRATIQGSVITPNPGMAGVAWRGAASTSSDNYVRLERGPFTYTTQFTFEALLRVNSFNATTSPYIGGIISQWQYNTGGAADAPGPLLRFGDGTLGTRNRVQLAVQTGVSNFRNIVSPTGGLSTGVLYHIVGMFAPGGTLRLFIDGRLVASGSAFSTTFNNNANNFISLLSDYANNATTQNRSLDADLFLARIYNVAKTDSEVRALYENPWQLFKRRSLIIPTQIGGTAYSLTADAGTYSLTGQAADLLRTAVLSADAGSYAIAGQDASLGYQRSISAEAGTYSIAGQIADFTRSVVLSADAGAYVISGQDANLARAAYLDANIGSYTLTGEAATLTYEQARVINAQVGSYAITGQFADLTRTYVFSADSGSYDISGQDVEFSFSRALLLDAGSYTISGQSADLIIARSVDAESGTYNIGGQPADLLATKILYADAGNYGISGQDAILAQGRYLLAESGSYLITGQPATLNTITLFPNPADVRAGVVYGPDGIYTGTLVASTPIYLFDD